MLALRLADLAAKICEARGELVLAGVGTFDTQKEHRSLMRLEARLSKMHHNLTSRAHRARRSGRERVSRLTQRPLGQPGGRSASSNGVESRREKRREPVRDASEAARQG